MLCIGAVRHILGLVILSEMFILFVFLFVSSSRWFILKFDGSDINTYVSMVQL